jgi:hypothetical protein
MNTKDKGSVSETMAVAAFTAKGFQVSIPVGENTRYDLIVDIDGALYKVQVKTGTLNKDGSSFKFNTRSTYHSFNGDIVCKNYVGDIDSFAVYVPQIKRLYFLSINDVLAVTACTLRLKASKNNQKSGILNASDFEFYVFGR